MLNLRPFSLFGNSLDCLPSGAATRTFLFSHAALGLRVHTGNEAHTDLRAELPRPLPGKPISANIQGIGAHSEIRKFSTALAGEASLLGNGRHLLNQLASVTSLT